jgi:hypothetical protein
MASSINDKCAWRSPIAGNDPQRTIASGGFGELKSDNPKPTAAKVQNDIGESSHCYLGCFTAEGIAAS